jgi:hypothetical protein
LDPDSAFPLCLRDYLLEDRELPPHDLQGSDLFAAQVAYLEQVPPRIKSFLSKRSLKRTRIFFAYSTFLSEGCRLFRSYIKQEKDHTIPALNAALF